MKQIRFFFLMSLALLCWGCSSDNDEAVQAEKAQMVLAQNVYQFDASGGDLDLRINSNVELTAQTSVDWIRQQPATREWSVKQLRFSVAENTGTEAREGEILITGGDVTQTVKVAQAGKEESQRAALKALYNATGGDQWTRHDNWCSERPIGEWYGVTVNDAGQVTRLSLSSNQLTGSLPQELGDLTALTYLNLNNNSIEGTLPESLSRLTQLRTFYFGLNRLTGDVPQCVTDLDYWPMNGSAEIVQQTGYGFNFASTRLRMPTFNQQDAMTAVPLTDDLLKEKPLTIVYFWSTEYNYDLGTVSTLHQAYKDIGLNVLAVNNDGLTGAALQTAIEQNGMKEFHNIALEDGWRFYPCVLLFNQAGECIYYNMVEESIGNSFEGIVREQLGEGSPMYQSTDYSRDGEYKQLQQATEGRGIDLVFLGEAFADVDIESGLYDQTMTAAMEEFFSVEPYKSFRNRFNVYQVNVVSQNNEFRSGAVHAVNESDSVAFSYATKIPQIDTRYLRVAVLYNTLGYLERSYASWYNDFSYVVYIMEDIGRATLVHEAGGHGFAHLMDEYVEPGNENLSLPESYKGDLDAWWRMGEYGANVDWRSDPTQVHWAHFLTDSRYSGEGLGIYEGAYFYGYGCYRPTENSMMRECSVGMPFNAPSREQIYKCIMRNSESESWTYDYERFVAYDTINRTSATTRALQSPPTSSNHWQRHRHPIHSGATWRDAYRK